MIPIYCAAIVAVLASACGDVVIANGTGAGTGGTVAAGGSPPGVGGSPGVSTTGGSTSSGDECLGGGCPGPGECIDTADCGPGEYCRFLELCHPFGDCVPKSEACGGPATEVCGCDGKVYASRCDAAAAGESVHVSLTECSEPPEGQFPCGSGYCTVGVEYCRQDADDEIGCAAMPNGCEATPTCSCIITATDCAICGPTKGGGALALSCG